MNFSMPVSNKNIVLTDKFWREKTDLIRKEVIPYLWKALNDEISEAEPSFCMRNFRLAADTERKRKNGYKTPIYPTDKWQYTEKNSDSGSFLGWVFQDSDCAKWIEAVGYSLQTSPDSKLEATADSAIDLVCAAQAENGYLDTLYTINNPDNMFTNLHDYHELYCFGHLAEGAISYYHATGKDKLLKAVCRFADLICDTLGENGKEGYGGHEIAELALVKLYETTGNSRYLETARLFIDRRGTKPYYFDIEKGIGESDEIKYIYNQSHIPVREQKEAVGHAVRAVYLYSGMADVSRLTNDMELFESCRALFDNIIQKKMYITGGIGSTKEGEAFTFDYDLPNSLAYAESCASIGLVFFARRMLQLDYDSKYADVMERCLYNGIISGMAEDGKSFFYVNPLEVYPEACKNDIRKNHVKPVRQKWFSCACCPPNIARIISDYSEYCFTENNDTLFINLYQSCRVKTDKCRLNIESDYLESGMVKINIAPEKPFRLALRIPWWSDNYKFSKSNPFIKKGYAYFNIDKNQNITAEFNPRIKIIKSHPLIRENIGKAAVTRGPFVYCLEGVDNGSNLHLLRLSHHPKFSYDGKYITANGYREIINTSELYKEYSEPKERLVKLKFIPYYTWANRGESEMAVFVRY